MTQLMLKFFIYSVLGCGVEVIWNILLHKRLKSRRMLLNLPMCPVYGIGGVVMSLILGGFRDNILILFAFGALCASAVELCYYLICVRIFDIKIWDYSDKKANLLGGVCGEYTLWWGLLSVIFVSYIDPVADRLLLKMSDYEQLIAVIFLSVVTIADVKATANVLFCFKRGDIKKLPPCFWYIKKIS